MPDTRKLPSSGRSGRIPRWPLVDDVAMRARRDLAAGRLESARFDLADAEGARRGQLELKVERLEEQVAVYDARLGEQRRLEAVLWRELWRTPQAAAWDALGWLREVAQYVRWKVLAELGDLDAGKEARQFADRLGLTPLSMLRLRWEIVDDAPAAQPRQSLAVVQPLRRPMVVDD